MRKSAVVLILISKKTITMKKLSYLPPEIEIIEIVIEKGFASSNDGTFPIDNWGEDSF